MAYDEKLADRVRAALGARVSEEKKMFGGLCFMVNGHMCCGIETDRLMLRVGPERYQEILGKKHASPMTFTGRPLKGFVYVDVAGCKTDANLKKWIEPALAFVAELPEKKKNKKKQKKKKAKSK